MPISAPHSPNDLNHIEFVHRTGSVQPIHGLTVTAGRKTAEGTVRRQLTIHAMATEMVLDI